MKIKGMLQFRMWEEKNWRPLWGILFQILNLVLKFNLQISLEFPPASEIYW